MPEENEIVEKLMEEHKDDFEPTDTSANDTGDDSGRDNSADNPEDAPAGDNDSAEDGDPKSPDPKDSEEEPEPKEGEDGPDEPDDKDEPGTKGVDEKKDANSRIRQLNEEKKAILAEKEELAQKLAEKIEAERKINDLVEDPIYTEDDFIGTVDENGDPLTDGEAKARFKAWEADYNYRQLQKKILMKEQADTLVALQSETKDAFTKFPEFNRHSDKYDKDLADIANEALEAGLIYQDGHEGDNNYIIGSRINPGQLLKRIHDKFYKEENVTKVNNLGDDNGAVISSKQVNKKTNQYAPGFRGEVDKEIDKLIEKKGNK